MGLFRTRRERRLWLLTLIVVAAIYSTLGLAGTLADELRNRDLLDGVSVVAFLILFVSIAATGLDRHPGRYEIWVGAGIVAVYGLVLIRIGIPEERTHLFEYGLVAVLIFEALSERLRGPQQASVPGWKIGATAIAITSTLGLIDEGIQALLPNRVFDMRDVGFNVLASLMSVSGILLFMWARHWRGPNTDQGGPAD